MPQLIGVVLAGGLGTRMGSRKGDLELHGKTLARRAAVALWPLCGSVLISVGPNAPNPAPDFPALEDRAPGGRGPLAGIDAAFAATGSADLLVLACDYPQVETDLLRQVLSSAGEEDDIVMPTDGTGRDHPLVALWRRSAASPVRDALERSFHKVAGLLPELRVRRLRPSDVAHVDLHRALINVNTPEDLAALEKRGRESFPAANE